MTAHFPALNEAPADPEAFGRRLPPRLRSLGSPSHTQDAQVAA